MNALKNAIIVFLFSITVNGSYAQSYIAQTKSLIWDLGPDDPRIDVKLGSKGINIGGYEDVAPVITNNFADELLVKIEFSLTDYCGETKVYTMTGKTLKSHERYAPSPFFEGYGFGTSCKKLGEYGPEKDRTKSRISRISHRIITLRNLTQEKKEAEEEKARKERELALKRQQEEEARKKAEEERKKADEERKAEAARLAEEKKQEETRKSEEAKRQAEAQGQQNTGNSPQNYTSTAYNGSGSSSSPHQDLAARQREAEHAAEVQREKEEAARKAAEEEHNRILYERHLAEQRRKEEERRAEEQRQQQLQQSRMQNIQDAHQVQAANEEVQDLQRLDTYHSNVEEMEREYAEKMSQLNSAMNNLEQARQQEWTSRVQSTDWGTDATSQQFGELVQTTGAFVNSLGEEKRKREARENLQRQRNAFLARVENEKAQMRFNLRTEMLKNFEAYNVPATKEESPTRIYGFYVLYNHAGLSAEQTMLTVSNVAEIGTYTDGTWPSLLHFRNIEAEQRKTFQYAYFHSKGYKSRAEAEHMKAALVKLFSKNGSVSETYVESNMNTADKRTDFWETRISTQQ